ncbi:MAG: dihydroneopterin aldolase [Selenomonadaceae bacterium]|nr:dihydroneopterin aldolase [Selenomonadaceae bacterium]
MDKIILTGIEIFGRHGCSVEEQQRGQIFKVDLELNLSLEAAGTTDSLAETVDYSQVLFDVERIVGGTPRKLIETVAEEIAETLLENYPKIETLKVVLHKPNAPLPVRYLEAAVEISRRRR